eukprot:TRINITY_DN15372_c0_g1_i1.p4 TRINITY_DN15372_c0_g1~~TRINITY_DN15372_c0_g1_i1.p4  ORF type:complete len:209 (-),score=0.86 TRINITY_DN15372_c0_g1_i1:208-834(-)
MSKLDGSQPIQLFLFYSLFNCLFNVEARRKLVKKIVFASQINNCLYRLSIHNFQKRATKCFQYFYNLVFLFYSYSLSSGQTLGVKAQRFRGHTSPHRNVKEKKILQTYFCLMLKAQFCIIATILVFNSINQLRNQLKILDYYAYTQNCCFVRKNLVQIYEDEFLLNIAILRVVKFDFFFLSVCFELQVGEKMYKQTINNSAPLYNQHQ